MKSAEEFDVTLSDEVLEAIREEMRQECADTYVVEIGDRFGTNAHGGPTYKAILNAGRPKLRKGQLVIADDGIRSTEDIFIYMEQGIDTKGFRPLRWSDLCGSAGLFPNHAGDGPVFLKEAMDD